MWETWVWSLGRKDPLEKEMATHSSIAAWRIPWTAEPGELQFMGLHRIGHNWSNLACTCSCIYIANSLCCTVEAINVLCAQSCPTLCIPWTTAHQAPLSMGFSRQEYWRGVPFPRVQINLLSHFSLYLMVGFLGHTWGFNFDAKWWRQLRWQ